MSNQEKCQRCGEVDHDRRTLWMACFYAMDELGLPFDEIAIRGVVVEKIGETPSSFGGIPVFADVPPDADFSRVRRFFTLRVCKDCRAAWMGAIDEWFKTVDSKVTEIDGEPANIPVRENGTVRYLTRSRWDASHPGREPVVPTKGTEGTEP